MESLVRETGLTVQAWKPTIVRGTSYVPRGQIVDPYLGRRLSVYSQTIRADGGWWSAYCEFAAQWQEAEQWYEEGVGRHIEVRNVEGYLIWAGFVDTVSIQIGTLAATSGPLMETANRVSVVYTPVLNADFEDYDPVRTGERTVTIVEDDEDSQDRYGILEEVLSGGQMLDDGVADDAARYRDTYIAEHRLPATEERIAMGGSSEVRVSLSLKGYVHLLQRYVSDDSTQESISIHDKLLLALGDDPNGLLSTDYSQVAANAFLVNREEVQDRTAWAVVSELVNLGDANDNRYTFGIYGSQRFHYKAVPDAPVYQHRLAQSLVQVEEYGIGTPVAPWDVRAGEWLFLADFLAAKAPLRDGPIRGDHRYVFIEEITYTAPLNIEIVGGRFGTLGQWLAKRGLGV